MSLRIDGLGWIRSFARPDLTMAGVVVRVVGVAGAMLLVVKMAEWIRDWGKPSLASVFAEYYKGPETHKTLQKVLNKARGDISFWGNRCIYVEGYGGSYRIEDVWDDLDLIARCNRREPFNLEQMEIGRALEERINQLDKDANAELPHKWFVTKALICFLERNPLGHARYIGKYSEQTYHESYTREAYINQFGEGPVGPPDGHLCTSGEAVWKAVKRPATGAQGEEV